MCVCVCSSFITNERKQDVIAQMSLHHFQSINQVLFQTENAHSKYVIIIKAINSGKKEKSRSKNINTLRSNSDKIFNYSITTTCAKA